MKKRRWLIAALVPLGLLAVAAIAFVLSSPQTILLVTNADEPIPSASLLIESEFDFNQARDLPSMDRGSAVVLKVRRLNESSISIHGRFVDGTVFDFTNAGSLWDPSPGDTFRIRIRNRSLVVPGSDRDRASDP